MLHLAHLQKDWWRPEEKGGAMSPRMLAAALFVKDGVDIDVINRAGGTRHALPANLIPTDGDLVAGSASAVRAGCRNVNPHYGMVRCDKGWHVVTNAAVAANIPPVIPVSDGPLINGPRGPAPGELDAVDEVEP